MGDTAFSYVAVPGTCPWQLMYDFGTVIVWSGSKWLRYQPDELDFEIRYV